MDYLNGLLTVLLHLLIKKKTIIVTLRLSKHFTFNVYVASVCVCVCYICVCFCVRVCCVCVCGASCVCVFLASIIKINRAWQTDSTQQNSNEQGVVGNLA